MAIKQVGPRRWKLTVSRGIRNPQTGRYPRVVRVVQRTERDARRAEARLLDEVRARFADARRLTVAAFMASWLETKRSSGIRRRTVSGYEGIIPSYVGPIGGLPLGRLAPTHLAHLEAGLLNGADGRRPLSRQTVANVHRVLHGALAHAVRLRLLAVNPAAAVAPPRPERPKLAHVGPDEAVRLLAAARGSAVEAVVVLALGTGLRRGEIAGSVGPTSPTASSASGARSRRSEASSASKGRRPTALAAVSLSPPPWT